MSIQKQLNQVRDALHKAGKDLTPNDWQELLEELGADIEGHLDALREEAKER